MLWLLGSREEANKIKMTTFFFLTVPFMPSNRYDTNIHIVSLCHNQQTVKETNSTIFSREITSSVKFRIL